jgi:hypothetical protein
MQIRLFVAVALLLAVLAFPLAAQPQQRSNIPTQPAPRRADGALNLGSTEPNKGFWMPRQHWGYEEVLIEGKEIPYQPWAKALREFRQGTLSKYDPEGYCLPPGGPRAMTTPFPLQFVQLPDEKRIVILYEGGAHIWRNIYMDGRSHPDGDKLTPTWTGHSVGRWEGDTLVVDVVGFNEGTWIDGYGDPHTELLHVVERFSRPNLMTLHYQATIEDPGAYTRPWTIAFDINWVPNGEIMEYICQENNLWLKRLTRAEQQ